MYSPEVNCVNQANTEFEQFGFSDENDLQPLDIFLKLCLGLADTFTATLLLSKELCLYIKWRMESILLNFRCFIACILQQT
jgi:hypothetical protein